MHLIKDENGNVLPHNHGDGHTHTHEHTHSDSVTHSHEHVHGEGHDHDHDHVHEHSHGCGHSHDCGSGCASAGECKNETVALLSYMLDHNEHHAAELDQMADNLQKLGMDSAAKQIRDAVSDFQKGNMRLSLALSTVKEQLKEA
ncbi:MAG: cobalt transporter [Clostridiales bacterium]|nr:cobalt transporter [Clostridiales bacterium]